MTRALQPIRLASPESLPAEQLIDWGQAKVPVGTLIAHIRSSEQTSNFTSNLYRSTSLVILCIRFQR